ncbi:hypothetical protein [Streptomyces sp. NRRL S-350]|uniref:hypothetical protein n=1 Tax=Streptomyces sp. NRRL S-350 TaxID=1463902 RepID=UPI000B15D06F|nr:hypothetical protein [Streptomyces sp. NRRL S-350]
MNLPSRRPLWQPFSEPATPTPQQDSRARLLAVERAPFLEPAPVRDPDPNQATETRRRLGPGGAADTTPAQKP